MCSISFLLFVWKFICLSLFQLNYRNYLSINSPLHSKKNAAWPWTPLTVLINSQSRFSLIFVAYQVILYAVSLLNAKYPNPPPLWNINPPLIHSSQQFLGILSFQETLRYRVIQILFSLPCSIEAAGVIHIVI